MSGKPSSSLPRDLAPWAALSILLFIYIISMCRDLYWYDSAELAIAALQPGLSHPPGQPLHTLAGFLFAHLFPGKPLLALNLFSALCAALTVLPAMSIARRLDPEGRGRPAWLGAAVLCGLGFNNAVWDSATRIEVYAPAALLAVTQIAHLLGTIEALNSPDSKEKMSTRWFVQGLLLGLVFSLHPYVAVFLAIATVAALARPLLLHRPVKPALAAGLLVAGGLVGLMPYAYIPIAAGFEGSLVWGDPSSIEAVVFYLGGSDYAQNRAPLITAAYQSMHFLTWMASHVLLLPVLLAGLAAWWLGWRARPWPGTGARFAPVILFVLGLAVIGRLGNYAPDIPDFMGYLLPVTWLAGAGLAAAAQRAHRTLVMKPRRVFVVVAIAAWIVANAFLPPSLPSRSRADNRLARSIASSFLMDAPENAIIVAGSDHVVFPLLYLHEVEGLRPDVVVLPWGFASSSWYWRHLLRRHPGLAGPSILTSDRHERIQAFIAHNPDRPVIAENLRLASLAAEPIVRSGWTLRSGAGSSQIDRSLEGARHDFARARLHAWLIEYGSPGTQDRRILSFIATQWGHDERKGGSPGQAVLDYLAGSPPARAQLPANLFDPAAWPLQRQPPPEKAAYTLMTLPTYNLLCAGDLLSDHFSARDAGIDLVRQASMLGSAEARLWLSDHQIPPGGP
ncbi:MAG: DUF2723 domain-containing protein [Deltaproteobacteria bacterium]|nr:DUF2723 domain-containing protein [Deltaproteobacteria bacterium]